MSTKDPNLKVIFGADTKDFDKGAKQVQQGLKDLDKSSSSMLSSLSNAFGVSSAKVEQMTSAVRGLGYKLVETGNSGAQALGSVLAKIGPLQAGIAGLGLAAAVAGFKALKAEAENFKSTIEGANMAMATSAYISTYKQVLHDMNSDTGRQVAQAMNEWEKGFGRFKANLAGTFVSVVGGESKWYDALLPTGIIRGWRTATANAEAADAAAERNEKRQKQINNLKEYELTLDTKIAENNARIAEYRRAAVDPKNDTAARAEAEANARALINENYDKQLQLAKAMAQLQVEMDEEASNTFDETKHTEELKQKILSLEEQRAQALQGIDKVQNRITSSANAQAAAAQKAREEAEKMAAVYSKWAGMGSVSTAGLSSLQGAVSGPSLSILPQRQDVEYFKETFQAYLGDWQLSIGIKPEKGAIKDFTSEVENGLVSMAGRTSEIIGNLVGTLAAGGNAWGDFKNAAVSALGDLAIAVGKIAIKMGIAAAGIDVALKDTGQWYIAVAAGAALVALGTAVKSSLSAAASGDYSAGGGGYSGGYATSSSGGDWEAREVNVNVTGTLVADGDQLVTVINNTNKKNYYLQ